MSLLISSRKFFVLLFNGLRLDYNFFFEIVIIAVKKKEKETWIQVENKKVFRWK